MSAPILVTPVTTEKAYGQSQKDIYVFTAPVSANKQQISAAIESQYGVKVGGIKTLVQSGKAIRFSRGKNRYPGTTHRTDSKKAYVTLTEGTIAVFEQATEEEKK
jgi:ribosomal protein L23